MQRLLSFALLLLACNTLTGVRNAAAAPELTQLAQAQPAPAQPATPASAAPDPATAPAADAPEEPIGNVATVTGSASVVRNNETTPLKVKDDIYLNDVVQTAANSSLGITFVDATTFNLKASSKITIDNYVYQDGGKSNAAIFDVARGTVAFVAAAVAKTGDMKITTPTASLGIRGTTGLVEVPEGGGTSGIDNIKLYPDADGRVGRIEVSDRAGARLGFLTRGASGFTIRPGIGGARVTAMPLFIPPQMMQRDQGFVRQLHSTQNFGRQVVLQQRDFRRANPNFVNPNRPVRQPGLQPNGAPGQNRPGQQQPGLPNRPGQPGQPQQPGQQNRQGQTQQPGQPNRVGQPPLPGQPNRQGQPAQPGQPGQPQQPGLQNRPGQQPPGLPGRQGQQLPPGSPQPGTLPPRTGQLPATGPAPSGATRFQPPAGPPPGVQQPPVRQGLGIPGLPGALRQGLPGRPALRLPPPKGGKPPPKDVPIR